MKLWIHQVKKTLIWCVFRLKANDSLVHLEMYLTDPRVYVLPLGLCVAKRKWGIPAIECTVSSVHDGPELSPYEHS